MSDLTKLKSGPAEVTLGGTSVGYTEGDTQVGVDPQVRDRLVSEHGSTPVGIVLTGNNVTVVVRVKEWAAANIQACCPGLVASGDGGYIGGAGATPGTDLAGSNQASAKSLLVRPVGASDYANAVALYKAVPQSITPIVFSPGESDRMFEVTFRGLADVSRSGKVGCIGIDPGMT